MITGRTVEAKGRDGAQMTLSDVTGFTDALELAEAALDTPVTATVAVGRQG